MVTPKSTLWAPTYDADAPPARCRPSLTVTLTGIALHQEVALETDQLLDVVDVVAKQRDLDQARVVAASDTQLLDRDAIGLRKRLELTMGRDQRLSGHRACGTREPERGDAEMVAEGRRDR